MRAMSSPCCFNIEMLTAAYSIPSTLKHYPSPDDDEAAPPPSGGDGADPRDGPVALRRRLRHDRGCSPSTAWHGKEHLPWASATGSARCPPPPAGGPAGPAAQRVPDRRRVRQPALRLRPAAARGGRADRRRRRLPALPAPGGPRHRPVRQARRVRAAGRRASTPTRPTWRSATARTSATTPPPRRCCGPWASTGSGLLSNNPDKAEQLDRLGVTVDRADPDRRAPVPGQRPLPGGQGDHTAHTLDLTCAEERVEELAS